MHKIITNSFHNEKVRIILIDDELWFVAMLTVEKEKEKIEIDRDELKKTQSAIREIAITYRESQEDLNRDLHREFDRDLRRWGAKITSDNRIRFQSPRILFEAGSSEISYRFENILSELFPRYIKILTSRKYRNEIDEIRIEGHTSYGWGHSTDEDYIYLKNMQLSQDRASSVLKYCYSLPELTRYKKWLIGKFRANGMSYSTPILKWNGKMDYDKSRRVEFSIKTKATEKVYKIIEELK
ncbi:outer membrane protein/peptidoglycan-associated (lipo)protein [Thiovulum sp. ES]|nr:outer membrane protein/peptidoglycan-associated (lipo)protein [Thiovulum sp. ES]